MELIAPMDIKAGDHIRIQYGPEYFDKEMLAREVVIESQGIFGASYAMTGAGITTYLLERPVPLPTKPGVYLYGQHHLYTLDDQGRWYFRGAGELLESMAALRGHAWLLLEPRAVVAREIITALDEADQRLAYGDPVDYAGVIEREFIN